MYRWYVLLTIIIIIGIQPLGRSGQRPEFSQATGMTLVRCILGKFLGLACHCFPLLFRCSHFSPPGASTSATTLSGNCGPECCPVILPKWRLPRHLGIFYMPQIYDMGLLTIWLFKCILHCNIFMCLYFYDVFHILLSWDSQGSMECIRVCVCVCMYEGWSFNSGNYLFTTDTK